jgi:putative ABC transport system substrate-binding protein
MVHATRRQLIMLLGGAAAAWPLGARAQQPERMRRVGVLMVLADNDPQSGGRITAFQQGLEKLGWTLGRNLAIDYRWGVSSDERARAAGRDTRAAL